MSYAIITVGGKQHRVREGERLLVDRLALAEGKTFHPDVLLLGGDGDALFGDELKGQKVTARVTAHVLGKKVVVGKHKPRTRYRRRNGFRARLTQIEIESIGTKKAASRATPRRAAKPRTKAEASTEGEASQRRARAPRKKEE